jgi:hypothetical protein
MSLEQFNVRRIRDGVTYDTKVSELLAYADGKSEESGASRWRAGLFLAASGTYFAVREESRRYFDQIAGRWTDGSSVSLDVLDYASALRWCESLDANILVDFTAETAAPVMAAAEETKAEPVAEAEPVEEPAAEEALLSEEAVPAEQPSALMLNISGDQKSAIEMEAQKAGMSLDAYLLHCVEVSRAAREGAVAEAAETEADCDECIEQALMEIGLEEAADAAAAVTDDAQTAPSSQSTPAEAAPAADDGAGTITLTVAEETESEAADAETPATPQASPVSSELLHHFHLAQRAANGGQTPNGKADLGRAAE